MSETKHLKMKTKDYLVNLISLLVRYISERLESVSILHLICVYHGLLLLMICCLLVKSEQIRETAQLPTNAYTVLSSVTWRRALDLCAAKSAEILTCLKGLKQVAFFTLYYRCHLDEMTTQNLNLWRWSHFLHFEFDSQHLQILDFCLVACQI